MRNSQKKKESKDRDLHNNRYDNQDTGKITKKSAVHPRDVPSNSRDLQLSPPEKVVQSRHQSIKLPPLKVKEIEPRKQLTRRLYRQSMQEQQVPLFCSRPLLCDRGVTSYFTLYNCLTVSLLLSALASIGPLYFNYNGTFFASFNTNASIFVWIATSFSLGNNDQNSTLPFLVTTILGYSASLLLLLGVLAGRIFIARQRKIGIQVDKVSYAERRSVLVTGFKSEIREHQIMRCFQHFGKVVNITLINNYGGKLQIVKEAADALSENNQLEYNVCAAQLSDIRLLGPIMAFVEFAKEEQKTQCLQHYKQHGCVSGFPNSLLRLSCCRKQLQPQYRLNGQVQLLVAGSDLPFPKEIQWQNADQRTYIQLLKCLVLVSMLLLIYAITVFVMAILASIGRSCPSSSVTLVCYCNALTAQAFKALPACLSTIRNVQIGWFTALLLAIAAFVAGYVVQLGCRYIFAWLRFFLKSDRIFWQAVVTGLTNFLIGCLPVLVMAKFQTFSPRTGLLFLAYWFQIDMSGVQEFQDFSTFWFYFFSVYAVWFMLLELLRPVLRVGYLLVSCSEEYKFNFEDDLGELLTAIFFCLTFGGGIPLLYGLLILNLSLRYFLNNYLIIKRSQIQFGVTHSLLVKVLRVVPWAVFLNALFSTWMYTAIFNSTIVSNYTIFTLSFSSLLNRFVSLSYGLVFTAAVLLLILLENLMKCCNWLCCCRVEHEEEKVFGETYEMSKNSEYEVMAKELVKWEQRAKTHQNQAHRQDQS